MNTYNLHPLLVHFPIALLFLYSIIKIIPFKKWFGGFVWKDVERIILLFGVIGAYAAFMTGDIARHLFRPDRNIVEWHEFFATASVWIYSLLLFGEILFILNKKIIPKYLPNILVKIFIILEKILTNLYVSSLLALIGLITISITGMLGGVMVYGVNSDPIAPIVLNLLGL